MRNIASLQSRDLWLAYAATAACGAGAALALAGAASSGLTLGAIGGAALAFGFIIILAARWLDPLIVLIASLPLPAFYSSTDFRLAPALGISIAVLAAWLLRYGAETRTLQQRAPLPLREPLLLGIALCVAAAFAHDRGSAAREIINWTLLLGLYLVAVRELRDQPNRRHTLARAIGIVAALGGAIAVLQTVGVIPSAFVRADSSFSRATLGFGWPNELGMFLALCLPFTVYVHATSRDATSRALAAIGIATAALGLIATFSRGSWGAVFFAPAILFLAGEWRRVLRIWAIAIVVGIAVDVLSGGAIRDRLAATIGDWVVEQRAALTLAGVLMFMANPLVGVGPGGFAAALEQYGPQVSWLWDYLPTAQNVYVQLGAETGVIGLSAYLFFLGVVLRRGIIRARDRNAPDRQLRITVLWVFATAILVGFGEWVLAHGIGQLVMLSAALVMTAAEHERATA